MDLFWHADTAAEIGRGLDDAVSGRGGMPSGETQILRDDLDRLSMICEALWQLLKTRLDLTDEQLMAEIAHLDLSDGVADGKVKRTAGTCPSCGRTVSRRHRHCIYCGSPAKTTPFG